jgi:hypothetical protein
MWYLYPTEFYSAMKKNEILSFTSKWMELENIILSEVSQAQKTKNRTFPLIWELFFLLFICAYTVWVISPPFPLPPPLPMPPPPSFPHPPHYQAETILPLSLILLKREYKK